MQFKFSIKNKELVTNRLILRAFTENDLNDFYEYAKVPGVGENAGWKHHENIEISKEILDLFINEDKTFAICLKENNRVIGSIGIEDYNRHYSYIELLKLEGVELGFVLNKEYWGRGIINEATEEIINYLFKDLNIDFILANYFKYNIQSKRVIEKLGFKEYKDILIKTRLGKTEASVANILFNPKKEIKI